MSSDEKSDNENDAKQQAYSLPTGKILLIFILLILCACAVFFLSVSKDKTSEMKPQVINEKIDDTTPTTDSYFQSAPRAVYLLARKIEKKQPITLDEVKALPEGALNARYGNDITLLFFALYERNLQAIDVLLAAGADPYMFDYAKGSVRDFAYYTSDVTMVKPDHSFDPEATKKFRYELTKIYLKNGGRADHIIPNDYPLSLLYLHAMEEDYASVRLLIDNGANPLWTSGPDDSQGLSAIMTLVTNYNDRSLELLRYIICKGYYKQANYKQVEHALKWFEPSGPKNTERERILRQLSMLVLKENPEFKDNQSTLEIFGGPIPWKEILDLKTSEVCHAK